MLSSAASALLEALTWPQDDHTGYHAHKSYYPMPLMALPALT